MMKVLVITGGIGSGKSMVCGILKDKYGIPVYKADKRAKELYAEVPLLIESMEKALEVSLRNECGDFSPGMLAEVIFNDQEALRLVEDMLFPVIKADFALWAEKYTDEEVVAFESATVLEKQQFNGFGDVVLLVNAPFALRLSRALERDKVDEGKVLSRMACQPLMNRLSDGESDDRIDYVIQNDASASDLGEKLREFIEKYTLTKML